MQAAWSFVSELMFNRESLHFRRAFRTAACIAGMYGGEAREILRACGFHYDRYAIAKKIPGACYLRFYSTVAIMSSVRLKVVVRMVVGSDVNVLS